MSTLCSAAFLDLRREAYATIFRMGGELIYSVFLAFIRASFVTGMCCDFVPNATHIWVHRALECANTTITLVPGWTNGTLIAAMPIRSR